MTPSVVQTSKSFSPAVNFVRVYSLAHSEHRRPISGTTRIHFSMYGVLIDRAIQNFLIQVHSGIVRPKIRCGIFIYILMIIGRSHAITFYKNFDLI